MISSTTSSSPAAPNDTVSLRDAGEEDLPILFEYSRDPAATRMAAFPAREEAAFYTHFRTKILGNPQVSKKAVIVAGSVAGDIGSWTMDGRRLVGYWLGSAYWGRGIATSALRTFLIEHERTRPIFAYVSAANVGSIRVLEKCGFRPDGEEVIGEDGVTERRMIRDA